MPDWNAEHIRLTAFPLQDPREPDPDWWRAVVGREPQAKTIQQGIAIQENGAIRDNSCGLSLEVRSRRIDWVMAPFIRPEQQPAGFPVIDTYVSACKFFRELIEPWLANSPPLRRLAFGSVLTVSVASKEAGYRELMPMLPSVHLDPINSSDFSYTINRHAKSEAAVPDLHINRLTQWSVALLTGIQIQADGTVPGLSVQESGASFSAVRLQMDINTAADRVEQIPPDRVAALFGELVTFADNIAQRGDVP